MFVECRDGPWPDPTQAYFWPAINKRPTCLWPDLKRFFLTRRAKIDKFEIFRANYSNSNPNHKLLTRPGLKIFDPDPSLVECKNMLYHMKNSSIVYSTLMVYYNHMVDGVIKKIGINCETCWTPVTNPHQLREGSWHEYDSANLTHWPWGTPNS